MLKELTSTFGVPCSMFCGSKRTPPGPEAAIATVTSNRTKRAQMGTKKMGNAMSNTFYDYYRSPIGLVEVGGTEEAVTSLCFVDGSRTEYESHPTVSRGIRQVAEYFEGTRRRFDMDTLLSGTEFQEMVWRQVLKVPYGQTASYKEIAKAVGRPKAARAVGAANGRNPISLIIPCHRIIGKSGELTGYGGGLGRKEWLLRHEHGMRQEIKSGGRR